MKNKQRSHDVETCRWIHKSLMGRYYLLIFFSFFSENNPYCLKHTYYVFEHKSYAVPSRALDNEGSERQRTSLSVSLPNIDLLTDLLIDRRARTHGYLVPLWKNNVFFMIANLIYFRVPHEMKFASSVTSTIRFDISSFPNFNILTIFDILSVVSKFI